MINKNENIKNSIIVLLDTSEKESIRIGKMEDPPQTEEEIAQAVLLDMGTLCEALAVMIRTADAMGIKPEADSMRDVIEHLNQAFVDPKLKVESKI
jgi:hypothetical protein